MAHMPNEVQFNPEQAEMVRAMVIQACDIALALQKQVDDLTTERNAALETLRACDKIFSGLRTDYDEVHAMVKEQIK